MKKKISAKLYTLSRIKYTKGVGLHYEELENNCLYSNLKYPTKITPEDLPKWFVKGRYYKNQGFLSAKGVVDMVYKPNMWINHMFRDDSLYISFNKPIREVESEIFGRMRKEYVDYDYVIDGTEAINFVAAVKKYSDYDTSNIEAAIIEKAAYYIEKFPKEHEAKDGDKIIEYLNKKFYFEK